MLRQHSSQNQFCQLHRSLDDPPRIYGHSNYFCQILCACVCVRVTKAFYRFDIYGKRMFLGDENVLRLTPWIHFVSILKRKCSMHSYLIEVEHVFPQVKSALMG